MVTRKPIAETQKHLLSLHNVELLKYFQEKVVFLPVILPHDHTYDFENDFEEYLWDTPFDGKINALHFRIKNPKVIAYFHGNADNLHRWGKEIAVEFTEIWI